MKLTILSPDNDNARRLEALLRVVVEENHLDANIERIRDRNEIERWPMSEFPGLARDGKLLISGRVPTSEELEYLLMR